jgi:hypothetical protein
LLTSWSRLSSWSRLTLDGSPLSKCLLTKHFHDCIYLWTQTCVRFFLCTGCSLWIATEKWRMKELLVTKRAVIGLSVLLFANILPWVDSWTWLKCWLVFELTGLISDTVVMIPRSRKVTRVWWPKKKDE